MNDRHPLRLAPVFAAALYLSGCAVGPNFKPPYPKVSASWEGVPGPGANAASTVTAQAAQLAAWWGNFHDPLLTSLVTEALAGNLDVRLAEARVRQARASRGIVAGGFWPGLTGSGGYQRSGGAGSSTHGGLFQAGLDALWELDLFGGERRNVESANAGVEAAKENTRDVQVTVAAEVALNYIQLRSAQEQVAIAEDNLKSEQHTADLTRQKLAAGFISALDVANANAQVATTASDIPVLQASIQQEAYALSVLLGRPPADLLDELSKPGPVPLTPPDVPVGLPSDLLRRRPDIREAEAQLHAATAQVGVAVSDFFPQFSLTGSVGYESGQAETLFGGSKRLWSFGPQFTWPIFQGGSVISNMHLQDALRDQAYLNYQKTVLTALQDVENALIAFAKEWDHRKALADSVGYNRQALDLSRQLYAQGTVDFLTVLDAERSLYASETALAQSKQSIAIDLVALYKALGGGAGP
jgi:multidrug efflux system outer membrane protein